MLIDDQKKPRSVDDLGLMGVRGSSTHYAIVEIAAAVFGARVAGISILNDEQRWFYSSIGIQITGSARQKTLCEHVADSLQPIVIPDLADRAKWPEGVQEPLFPKWRFYAGTPIILDHGLTLGVLFVADEAPITPSPRAVATLDSLAGLSVDSFRLQDTMVQQQEGMLALHRQTEALERSNIELDLARKEVELASQLAKMGFWSLDVATGAFDMSPTLAAMLGASTGAATTLDSFGGFFTDEGRDSFLQKTKQAIDSDVGLDVNLPLRGPDGAAQRWLRTVARIDVGPRGKRIVGCAQDVTDEAVNRKRFEADAAAEARSA